MVKIQSHMGLAQLFQSIVSGRASPTPPINHPIIIKLGSGKVLLLGYFQSMMYLPRIPGLYSAHDRGERASERLGPLRSIIRSLETLERLALGQCRKAVRARLDIDIKNINSSFHLFPCIIDIPLEIALTLTIKEFLG